MKKSIQAFIYLTESEWAIVIHSLNVLRNKLISENRDTDIVDETLLKVMEAKSRKVKIAG